MRFDLRCSGCGKVFARARAHPGQTPAALMASYAKQVRAMRCPCGRVSVAAPPVDCPRRGHCHEALVVLRGAGGAVSGTGRWRELGQLHEAHLARGGRYDPRPVKPPRHRHDPPGTARVSTPDGMVVVPPGQVVQVGQTLVDTRGGRVSVTTAVSSDPPAKIPPSDRRNAT